MSELYTLDNRAALTQLVVTGSSNVTPEFKDEVLKLAATVDSGYIAKLAIYASKFGQQKDTPVLLLAYLAVKDTAMFKSIFNIIITNVKLLRRFVEYMRTGVVGRKSLGTVSKRAVQQWLDRQLPENLYWQSIGKDGVSMKDVIRLAHPAPSSEEKNAMYAFFNGVELPSEYTPTTIRNYKQFISGETTDLPLDVPMMRLMPHLKTQEHWKAIVRTMTWNQTRLNLNTLTRHQVWDSETIKMVTDRLTTRKELPAYVLPFAVWSTIENLDPATPAPVKKAMLKALEMSLSNVPELEGHTKIYVDHSGSMGWKPNATATSYNKSVSTLTYSKIASFFGAGIKATNKNAEIYMFNNSVSDPRISEKEALEEIIRKLSQVAGGTDVSAALQHALKGPVDNLIIISDNESWMHNNKKTNAIVDELLKQNPKLQIVLWDIAPRTKTPLTTRPRVHNIGGYSDAVYKTIEYFNKFPTDESWVDLIEQVKF